MTRYPYLIIGGGMTADAAIRGIRELDTSSSIGLIGAELDPPYSRPPLSKALWKGDALDTVWRKTPDAGVDMHLGRSATRLDLQAKKVIDDRGVEFAFDKLLLATGGTPRRLPFGGERVIYYRTLEDYRRLRALAEPGRTFVVIGGGFIGSEIAAALAMQGCKVTMLFPEDGIGARLFPADLARFLVDFYRSHGVDVRPGESVSDISDLGPQVVVSTKNGLRLTADAVVAGLGIIPNTDLARDAGLLVDDGIVVDESPSGWPRRRVRRRRCRAVPCARRSGKRSASSMRTMRSPWGVPRGARWRETVPRTRTCRSSTRTCSTSGTKRSARWIRAGRQWRLEGHVP